jgi:hypothetical protein
MWIIVYIIHRNEREEIVNQCYYFFTFSLMFLFAESTILEIVVP